MLAIEKYYLVSAIAYAYTYSSVCVCMRVCIWQEKPLSEMFEMTLEKVNKREEKKIISVFHHFSCFFFLFLSAIFDDKKSAEMFVSKGYSETFLNSF